MRVRIHPNDDIEYSACVSFLIFSPTSPQFIANGAIAHFFSFEENSSTACCARNARNKWRIIAMKGKGVQMTDWLACMHACERVCRIELFSHFHSLLAHTINRLTGIKQHTKQYIDNVAKKEKDSHIERALQPCTHLDVNTSDTVI